MIEAKCYYVTGWWRYYRTADGRTFAIRDNTDIFYHGNVYENHDILIYIKNSKKLRKYVKFVEN